MMEKRKYIRLYGFDYSRIGAYFVTVCTHKRQRLFGEIPIKPNGWFKETGHFQYSKMEGEMSLSPVGAHPCVRPKTIEMIEYWIHRIPTKFKFVTIDYYVIMPDHIHLILFFNDIRDAHMGAPLQKNSDDFQKIKENHKYDEKLYDVIKWFKTMTTNDYIHLVKEGILPPFDHHVWQRGYYDHVIRNRDDLYECRKYIKNNPARWLNENK